MNLAKLAVVRPIAMAMVIIFMLIIGSVSVKSIPIDLFPDLTFPVAVVAVTYENAGPEEIEQLVTAPLENILGTVPNVESISSISRTGGSLIIVSYNWGTDMDFAALKMREKLDSVRDFLPQGVAAPRVLRFDPSDFPIVQLALSTENGNVEEAKKIAEYDIKPLLDSVEGVASISVEGGVEREIQLSYNPSTLASYGITVQQLKQIIQSENITVPGGIIEDAGSTFPVRIIGTFQSLNDIKTLPIPTASGTVPLEKIVVVKETLSSGSQKSFLNGVPSVGLSILKQSEANTVQVSNRIAEKLELLNKQLPEGVEIKTIFDQSMFIKKSISAVTWNMIIGSILAGAILYLFLRDWRSTFIIGLSIPVSILTTFIFMYFYGLTINLLTLGGLALGIGMMVDNSIVILENIFRLRQQGKPLKEAAIQGTKEVGPAIIASTITTVVVFLPIVFVDGLAAQLFKPLALVISFSLIASLFTALIIVPLLSSLLIKTTTKESKFQLYFNKLLKVYSLLLRLSLKNTKKTIIITTTLLVITLSLTPFIGREFLPAQDQSFMNLVLKLPAGSSLSETLEVTEEVQLLLDNMPEIELAYATVGGSNNFSVRAGSETNRANFSILLKPINERNMSDIEIGEYLRKETAKIPNLEVEISAGDSNFSGDPISIKLVGSDLPTMKIISEEAIKVISSIEGVREVRSSFDDGAPQISVSIDRDKAAQYGIGTGQIAQIINEATNGIAVSKLARNGNELNIILTLENTETMTIDDVEDLLISSPLGITVPIHAVATIKQEKGPVQITRTDRLRQITITGQLLNRDLGSVMEEIEEGLTSKVKPLLPSGYKLSFGGQDEQMNDAFFKLSMALLLAVVLVYMVMAGQFESFKFPFIIMFSVPLTIIGIIIGQFITFTPFSVGSLIGVLILTGVVVNNAIVLVDSINEERKSGASSIEAILTASPKRLRPILMTALTTILGLIPLSLGFGEGTEIQQPMAIVIIFGLGFATFITLIFIPVVYHLFASKKEGNGGATDEDIQTSYR
ncbi:acriflavin resistance protein [Lottiidibacillus patelloidae]|uniref:Acriflavin resistance protein n=1 Tax=Lottiidibacillus patelloidae TaxID=2670334 RepID=A0A263BYL9_9BACI|nr:efflux RND transporter permease subunit [Lottiidibacillus patelloidae]OZM58266.1 acriflavin resistance protein [Lottiidibacillus patelloidae]